MRRSALLPWFFVLLTCGSPLTAQEAGGWRLGVGGGVGTVLAGHDLQDPGDAGWALHLTALRGRRALSWGIEWIGAWLASSSGGDHRHHVGVVMLGAPGWSPVTLRGGLGFALVTVADVDAPNDGEGVGDVVIGIGDYGTIGLSGGVEGRIGTGLRSLALVPAADVMVQRAGGRTLALLALTLRLETGGG